jgi:cytosine/adenosine deaminase-related metal-dependent hydrolase
LADYGLAPGCRADLLLLPAETVAEAVAQCPRGRMVLRRGRLVAQDGKALLSVG